MTQDPAPMEGPINVRKRPVACQAMRFKGNAGRVLKWIANNGGQAWLRMTYGEQPYLNIRTLEGVLVVAEGDWVVRGVKGEFHPVRADIFAETYDLV